MGIFDFFKGKENKEANINSTKDNMEEIMASIYLYLLIIFLGFDEEVRKKNEGEFRINNDYLHLIDLYASSTQSQQFQLSIGFTINEISKQTFYSKLLSISPVAHVNTLKSRGNDKNNKLFKNLSKMMRTDNDTCFRVQILTVGQFASLLLDDDNPTISELVDIYNILCNSSS